MKLFIVTGGVGKHVIFSSLIEDLASLHGGKIAIMSAYPDVFKYHPKVERSVAFDEPGFYDSHVSAANTDIIHFEPYFSNYAKGKTHIADEWAIGLGLDSLDEFDDARYRPDVYVDTFAMDEAERFKSDHGDFIVVQFSGGQSPLNFDRRGRYVPVGQVRNYPREYAQELVNRIKEARPDLTVLNYALPNEDTAGLENTMSIEAPYLFYVALCQLSAGTVCIDSSLMHFAANRWNENVGVCLWGSTGPRQLGYDRNFNLLSGDPTIRPLTNTMGDAFNADGSPWRPANDRIMLIDPAAAFSSVEKMMEKNADAKDGQFENVVVDEERKTRVIDLDPTTSQLLVGLAAQRTGIADQMSRLVNGVVENKGFKGNYVLSEDGTKLLKR
jgi:hypothetical protein